MKFVLKLSLLLGLVLGCAGFWSYRWLENWGTKPYTVTQDVVVDLEKGMRLTELATALKNNGVIDNDQIFRIFVRLHKNYAKFQAGKYRFELGAVTPLQVIQKFSDGEIYVPVILQFTIPEGFTLQQISARLEAQKLGTKSEILSLFQNKAWIKELGIDAPTLEGYLYPATYQYTKMPTLKEVVQDMVQTFWERLPKDYINRVKAKKFSLHQAVTFASLIELETMHDDEKTQVSEVIWRRLKAGEPIAIDAALIYGIKDYRGDIKWSHLRDAKNPYNTRIHKGLPPGPVGSPDSSSLEAVLNPTEKGYYFYVLKPNGEFRHHFSTSLSEHNRYVKLLLDAEKKK